MMKTAVCTISTESHVFKSRVLFRSVNGYGLSDLFCLLTDTDTIPESACGETYHHLNVLQGDRADAMKRKYKGNRLRWGCKPLYLLYLFGLGYEKVIYVDNDICFHATPGFLFDKLDTASVLLTPHFYPTDTRRNQNWLEANFRVGLFNAGFMAVTPAARTALEWWADCCLYAIRKSAWRGLFDDQKYLDLFPVSFPGVEILTHKGCNVAGWNTERCPRSLDAEGRVLLDGKYPLVFVHYTPLTMKKIENGEDPLLAPYQKEYLALLQQENPSYSVKRETALSIRHIPPYLRYLYWQIIPKS